MNGLSVKSRMPHNINVRGSILFLRFTVIAAAVIFVTSCCMFVPCHLATRAIGTVTDINGSPISKASVYLYGAKQMTGQDGCFKYDMADRSPFTFTVKASGYKPIEVQSKHGYFKIRVELALDRTSEASKVSWEKISKKEFEEYMECP